MAKRPRKAQAKRGAKTKAGPKSPQVVIVGADEAPQFYANHVEISHNIHEFEMIFGRLPSRLTTEEREDVQATGSLEIETLLRIIIPPSLLQDLMNVLSTQRDKFKENVGPLPGVEPKE